MLLRHLLVHLAPIAVLVILGSGFDAVGLAAIAIPTSGPRFDAVLVGLTADGQAKFMSGGVVRTMPLADVVAWGALVEPGRGVQVLLAGGGLVVAESVRAENEKLVIESGLLGRRIVPLEFLAGIIYQSPPDHQDHDRLTSRVLASTARNDRLLLENGDELTGTVTGLGEASVELESQRQKITVEIKRIAAVAFDPTIVASAKPAGLRILTGLRDGSRLLASRLTLDDRDAQLILADKSVWSLPADSIVYLQPLAGRAKYVSDLTAEGYRHLPLLSGSWPYRNDANVIGTQLRAGGRPYVKGIGMHSAGRLTYRLDKRYRTFEADVALDDHVGRGGAAAFAVYVDDKLAWKSDCLRGGMPPVPVKVEVAGAKRLSLIVEFADRGDELDRADWLDARLLE
jgi:hypothetical protein